MLNKGKKIYSVQEWLPFDIINDNGIIKMKDNTYVKILEVIPINFNLKSELEKKAILNSYKIFLKTCNFNFQILIQSRKQDLNYHISKLNTHKEIENKKIKEIINNYVDYLKKINQNKKNSNKNFYIIIKNNIEDNKHENIVLEELNDNYFKIKECLARCGNIVRDVSEKDRVVNIIKSFINKRFYLINN